jgi:mRNA (2'-O-methyladenosine-N6-)-methyltransferase
MDLKAEQVAAVAHPPLYIPLESHSAPALSSALAPHRFDVILIHPPRSWAATAQLPIRQLSADPGFVFLWVGSGDAGGLERGRECLAKWGFRRAEDIVWVKTNKKGATSNGGGLFASQKEHCLMGIRGTVRRSTDSRFVHCNVDTDVIVWEEGESNGSGSEFPQAFANNVDEGAPRTPPYLYTLIENFCLGARRLELFNDTATPRRGWVSASLDPLPEGAVLFDGATYPSLLPTKEEGKPVVPFHAEIDLLRPKSPQRRGRAGHNAGRPHGHATATATPPPSHTPPFRPPGGVMRMGSLTPAQGYASQLNPAMFQHQHQHQHQYQHHHNQGMHNPMHMPMNNMNMGGMMPMNMGMQGMPMQGMQGMQGMMPMQFQNMGMAPGMMGMGLGGMPMGMPMPMGLGMGGGGMPMGGMQGMGGGMGGMGMGGMQGMQMQGMMGMPMMMPGMQGTPPIGSPQMAGGAATSPPMPMGELTEEEWGYTHGHAMGQLAMGMGAMGTPYLGGYQYNG